MALSADRDTPRRDGDLYSFPVAASTEIFQGSLVVLDASGNAEPGSTATGKVAVGCASEYVDNSSGSAADVNVEVTAGIFRWENSGSDAVTKASIGDTVYIEDDETVCATATSKSAAGVMVDIDSLGVWVETKPPVTLVSGLTAANNLSDVGTATTARTNLGVGTGDTPDFTGVGLDAAGVGTLKTAKVSITAAELKALAATPKTIVSAVANVMLVPVAFEMKFEYGSETLAEPSAPDELQFKYVDGSGTALSAEFDATAIIIQTNDTYTYGVFTSVEGATLAEGVNVPIVLHNTGGEYTGNASNDSVSPNAPVAACVAASE